MSAINGHEPHEKLLIFNTERTSTLIIRRNSVIRQGFIVLNLNKYLVPLANNNNVIMFGLRHLCVYSRNSKL